MATMLAEARPRSVQTWAASFSWLWKMSPLRVLSIVPLSIANAVMRIVNSGLLIQFLTTLASGEAGRGFSIRGTSIGVDIEPDAQAQWIAIIGVSALALAGLAYLEQVYQLRVGRRFAYFATGESLRGVGADRPGLEFDPGNLVRAAAAVLGLLGPVIRIITLTAIMLYFRPALTLVVLGLSLVFMVPAQMLLGQRILASSRKQRASGRGFKQWTNSLLDRLHDSDTSESRDQMIDRYLADDAMAERVDAALEIRVNQRRATVMSGVLWAIASVVFAIGLAVTDGGGEAEIDVSAMLLYVLVGQMLFAAVAQASGQIALFHRHYYTLAGLVAHRDGGAAPVDDEPPRSGEVWLVNDALPSAARPLGWLRTLDSTGWSGPVQVIGRQHLSDDMTLAEVAQIGEGSDHFVPLLIEAGVDTERLDPTDRMADLPNRIRRVFVLVMGVLPALDEHQPAVIVLDARVLRWVPVPTQRRILSDLGQHHLILSDPSQDDLEATNTELGLGAAIRLPSIQMTGIDDGDDDE